MGNKARVASLISYKIDCKTRGSTRDKTGHFIMSKGIMNLEARMIRNIDMTSNRVSKTYEAKTDGKKEKRRNPQIINLDILLSVIEQVAINQSGYRRSK